MKIKKFECRNWCKVPDGAYEFVNGINGLLGPNGSGKSTMVAGIIYALTGNVKDNKIDYLRYGETAGHVALEFVTEEDQKVYRIERDIHGPGVRLFSLEGGEWEPIANRSTEAKEHLANIIALSGEMASRIYATPQSELVRLWEETPSERNKILQNVVQLQFITRMRNKLYRAVADSGEAQNRIIAQKTLLTDQLAAKQAHLATLVAIPPKEALDQQFESLNVLLTDVTNRLGAVTLRAYLEKEIATTESQIATLHERLSIPEPVDPYPEESIQDLQESVSCSKSVIKDCELLIDEINAYLAVPDPVKPDVSLESVHESIANCRIRLHAAETHYKHVTSCGTSGFCPTCGSRVEFTEDDLRKAQEDYVRETQKLSELQEYLKLTEQSYADYRYKLSLVDRKRSVVIEHLDRLGFPEGSRDEVAGILNEFKKMLEDHQALVATESKLLKAKETYNAQYSKWKLAHDADEEKLEGLKANLEAMTTNPVMTAFSESMSAEELQARKNAISEELEKVRKDQILRMQYDAMQAEVLSLVADIATMDAQLKEMHPELREKLSELHELCQVRNLPTRIAYSIYKTLVERMNVYLSAFEAPYRVELEENGNFVCTFQTGLRQNTSRLSGGEKMVLAVSFRLALHAVFATDDTGGFIMLDEPTTFLDEKNRESLFTVLNSMRLSPTFRDLQIFIVTHDDILRPLFDNVIDLGGQKC